MEIQGVTKMLSDQWLHLQIFWLPCLVEAAGILPAMRSKVRALAWSLIMKI